MRISDWSSDVCSSDLEIYVQAAMRLAGKLNLPVVATHPVQFLQSSDFRAHEARVCIAEGEQLGNARRVRRFTEEQYLLSSQEMAQRFADVPSALANSVEIAKRCSLTRSEEHTSELQSLMRISYAVFCLKKKKTKRTDT